MAESTRLVAARIPDTLAEEAERYALLARTTLSHLIRQGLELRLHTHRWPRGAGTTPPGSVPTHVAVLLADLARHLAEVRQELAACQPPEPPSVDTPARAVAVPLVYADDLEDMPLHPAPPPIAGSAFDPRQYRLGLPCKRSGHQSHGERGNLRTFVQGKCVACLESEQAAKG